MGVPSTRVWVGDRDRTGPADIGPAGSDALVPRGRQPASISGEYYGEELRAISGYSVVLLSDARG